MEFTPAGWTFGVIWATIYTWSTVGLVYCLTTLRRTGPHGRYLYVYPPLTPVLMYVSLFLNLVSNLTWIFMWDRQIIEYSVIPSALMAFFLYCMLFFTLRATRDHESEFKKYDMMKEVWMVRMMLQNPMAFYATWVTIATLLNLSIAMHYRGGVDSQDSVTVLFCVLAVEVIGWFVLDVFVIDRYTQYIFTPYVVVIIALFGSLDKNWKPNRRNQIFSATLLGVVGVLTIVKFVRMFMKRKSKMATIQPFEMEQRNEKY